MAQHAKHPDLSRPPVEITWDVPTQELAHQVAALMKQADKIANHVQGLPTRDDYDAVVAENKRLRENIRHLMTITDQQGFSIDALLAVAESRTTLDLPAQQERLGRLLVDIRGGIKS